MICKVHLRKTWLLFPLTGQSTLGRISMQTEINQCLKVYYYFTLLVSIFQFLFTKGGNSFIYNRPGKHKLRAQENCFIGPVNHVRLFTLCVYYVYTWPKPFLNSLNTLNSVTKSLKRICRSQFQKQDFFFFFVTFLEILSRISPQYRYMKNIMCFNHCLREKKQNKTHTHHTRKIKELCFFFF